MKNIKISLKAARINKKLKMKEASKMLKITDRTLYNYENGKTMPDYDVVIRIAALYEIPVDNLFFERSIAKSDTRV